MPKLGGIRLKMEKYQSILKKPYQKSTNRKHMSLNDRAAQFAPFAALTGYDEVINAYNVALKEGYRFGFYGDALLILPD